VTASSATASPPVPSVVAPEQEQAAPVLPFRVGYGFDLHRLVEGKKLIICGIDVPHVRGCDAHSDGESDLHCTNEHAQGCWNSAWHCSENKSTTIHVTHASLMMMFGACLGHCDLHTVAWCNLKCPRHSASSQDCQVYKAF